MPLKAGRTAPFGKVAGEGRPRTKISPREPEGASQETDPRGLFTDGSWSVG